MLYPTQTRVSHTSAKRQISNEEQSPWCTAGCFQSVWAARRKEPWPCLCGPARRWDTGSRSNAHNPHAIPWEVWLTLQCHKTHWHYCSVPATAPRSFLESTETLPMLYSMLQRKAKRFKRSLPSKVENTPSRPQMWWQTSSVILSIRVRTWRILSPTSEIQLSLSVFYLQWLLLTRDSFLTVLLQTIHPRIKFGVGGNNLS